MSLSSLLAQAFSNGKVNQYWGGGGGSRIYKSEYINCFRTFLILLCVLLIQMEIIGGGGA